MNAIVRDLMSSAGSALLDVLSQERANKDLVVLLEDLANRLKMQTLEAVARAIYELHGIVLEAPLPAFQNHDIIDLSE
jgi:hypothetical protein